mgnify:CR=1 FL=1
MSQKSIKHTLCVCITWINTILNDMYFFVKNFLRNSYYRFSAKHADCLKLFFSNRCG